MTAILDFEVLDGTVAEMLIDFADGTWTCSEHKTVMRLDSGEDCPRCRVERPMPLDEPT
jgi:hypothetical protein